MQNARNSMKEDLGLSAQLPASDVIGSYRSCSRPTTYEYFSKSVSCLLEQTLLQSCLCFSIKPSQLYRRRIIQCKSDCDPHSHSIVKLFPSRSVAESS